MDPNEDMEPGQRIKAALAAMEEANLGALEEGGMNDAPPAKRAKMGLGGPTQPAKLGFLGVTPPNAAIRGTPMVTPPTGAKITVTAPKVSTGPVAPKAPKASGELVDVSEVVKGAEGKNPVQVVNEYCQKTHHKNEWVQSGAAKSWRAQLLIRDQSGTVVSQASGMGENKKEAQLKAAEAFLANPKLGTGAVTTPTGVKLVPPGTRPVAPLAGAAAGKGFNPGKGGFPFGAGQPQAGKGFPHGGEASSAGQQEPQLPPAETFGYTLDTGRMRLNEYLTQRNLPLDIPTTGTGPFQAVMQIPLPQGRGAVWSEASAGNKREAVRQVALRLVSELCKHNEIPPFQSKQEKGAEQLRAQPCETCIRPGLERGVDELLFAMGVPPDLQAIGRSIGGQSILRDFNPAQWAAQPEVNDVSWTPAEWGKNPWAGRTWADDVHSEAGEDETAVRLRLMKELEAREKNPAYMTIRHKRNELPIAAMESDILDAIEHNPVTLIQGSTGCGKTTQLPQMLLERAIARGDGTSTNIACTQPRRIAAITVAERVAKERNEPVGKSVGYNVRFAKQLPRAYGSICYMTPGMLLRWLIGSGLRGVSHLILDEVHERDLDTDFLLTVIRRMLQKSSGLRVVLMSATMDLTKWSDYFGGGFKCVEIPGRLFPVDLFYLEDVAQLIGPVARAEASHQNEDVNVEAIEKLVARLVKQTSESGVRGAILCFLPGWESIKAVDKLLNLNQALKAQIKLHLLHSTVPKEEQQAAFEKAPAPLVKVILSTNIAESSVTISDVVYVIDSCRVKQLTALQASGGRVAYKLMNVSASKQNLQQRAGRAGRVRKGMAFRLISKKEFEYAPDCLMPDMVRLPLHQVALTVKALNLGGAEEFLGQAPDPPDAMQVRNAIETLCDLKALDWNENVTDLGLKLAKLPLDPRMGFALIAACMMGLGEPMAVISALAAAPPLYNNMKTRGRGGGTFPSMTLLSDHHDGLVTYYQLKELPPMQVEFCCMRECINYKAYKYIKESTEQTLQILRQMDFDDEATGSCKDWIFELGTGNESDEHTQLWSALTFLLGFGLEHFGMRKGFGRKVWTGAFKTSQITLSPGVPDTPPATEKHPFILFGELRESEWQSKCSGVTGAGAVATILGAGRDMCYDRHNMCLMIDGWAPVRMSPQTAARLIAMRMALRMCLLNISKQPQLLHSDPCMAQFRGLLFDMCRPIEGK